MSVRNRVDGGTERFREETLRGLGIALRTQEELNRVSLRIHRPVEIRPNFPDFDVRLVHFPGIGAGFEMRTTALLQLWSRALDPAVDGGVIDMQTPFTHHFFQIAIAEPRISNTNEHRKG